jgi:integrase
VVRRLARRQRQQTQERIRHEEGSNLIPGTDEARGRPKKNSGPGTVAEVCQAWADTRRSQSQNAGAIALAGLLGNAPVGKIGPQHIAAITARWKLEKASATHYTYVAGLRLLLRVLRPDLLPAAKMPRYRVTHRDLAKPGELDRLLAVASPWMRALLIIASQTGLRAGDCMRLSEAHCDPAKQALSIEQGKTKMLVSIPISPELQRLIELAPQGGAAEPLVNRYAGHTVKIGAVYAAIKKIKRRAGVNPRLVLHSFRHTIAVALYDISKDLRLCQQLLGHQSLMSTLRYLEHADPAKLHPMLAQLWKPQGTVQ